MWKEHRTNVAKKEYEKNKIRRLSLSSTAYFKTIIIKNEVLEEIDTWINGKE